ncbi:MULTISPECIES: hypothetical protein [Photorhabdus]|uniref:Transposase n=2 Tax=Photorhabdus TaxID=29487 RepID=A0AAW6BSV0_9GAMM|nr:MULTISPECIES: hypothetical protein [Photorhabdus]EYU15074.1 hypothetical protein BA1DRAFT_02343 [Photorhabdus aegyptia]MDB6374765.1 hypothetical protein [Photorhabdus bodei]
MFGIEMKKDRVLSTFSVDKVVDKNVDIQKFSQCTIKGRWYLFVGKKQPKNVKIQPKIVEDTNQPKEAIRI